VVVEFGSQSNLLSYMLATNVIARRIHASYVRKAERFLQTKNPRDRPTQLMITIEEAHRFLDPATARQTIFGTIAREMRKYFVTLLVVDQRPSGIDNEVMSQIGTRITALLNDEKDIDAIFTGVSGAQSLRSVLAKAGLQAAGPDFGPRHPHAGGGADPPLRCAVLPTGGGDRLGGTAR
jgi:DNA helicase HerA-like ATPase